MFSKILIVLLLAFLCMSQGVEKMDEERRVDSPAIPKQFQSYPAPKEIFQQSYPRFSSGCCTYHWIFAIDNTNSVNLIVPWIMRWFFQFQFHQIGGCDQFMSTFSFGSVATFHETFVTSIAFNPILPTTTGGFVNDYGIAIEAAINMIISYTNFNSCAVFISDGGSSNFPITQIQLFQFIVKTMANCYKRCVCAMCFFTGPGPVDITFQKTCNKIGASFYANPNAWNLAVNFWTQANQKMYNSQCNC